MSTSSARPILALTLGDPVGVGPEIIVKALADARIYRVCRPLVLGDLPALERARLAMDPAILEGDHEVMVKKVGRISPI